MKNLINLSIVAFAGAIVFAGCGSSSHPTQPVSNKNNPNTTKVSSAKGAVPTPAPAQQNKINQAISALQATPCPDPDASKWSFAFDNSMNADYDPTSASFEDDKASIDSSSSVYVPKWLQADQGTGGNGTATLSFVDESDNTINCTYKAQSTVSTPTVNSTDYNNGTLFKFVSCDDNKTTACSFISTPVWQATLHINSADTASGVDPISLNANFYQYQSISSSGTVSGN